jgi:Fe-S-cluster-containing dehydrogenase component
VQACRETNAAKFPEPRKPFPKMYPSRVKVSDWSERREVMDRLTPYNWLFIQHAAVKLNGEDTELAIPRRCMHCVNPPCVKLCPWGSAKQLENGISWIDADICLGGSKCKNVCPWDIPQRQTGVGLYLDLLPSLAGNGVMYKCDR